MRAAAACLLAAILGGGTPVPAAAQDAGAPVVQSPILTLDQERLYAETLWGQRAAERIKAASSALAAENRRIEAELTAEEKDLTERRAGMEAEAFQAEAEAFDQKVVDLREAQDAKARSIGQMHDAERQRFFAAALPVISEVLRSHNAIAVLDSRAIFIAVDAIDVTDELVARIDEALGPGEDAPLDLAPAEAPAPDVGMQAAPAETIPGNGN